MKINVRPATEKDKQQAIYVESKATPNLRYVERMWTDFTSNLKEPLYVAEINGKIVGIGKFTVLPDNSAWLETLRVDKDYQGLGVGKAIYNYYLQQAQILKVNAIRMYTGVNNAASAGLAKLNGFTLAGEFAGADYVLTGAEINNNVFFQKANYQKTVELLSPLEKKWNSFLILNRTFYKMNKDLYRYLSKMGFVYFNNSDLLVVGARFMPERALQFALYEGNATNCFNFAVNKAKETGVNKINIMLPPNLNKELNELHRYGFKPISSNCIVMERVLNR